MSVRVSDVAGNSMPKSSKIGLNLGGADVFWKQLQERLEAQKDSALKQDGQEPDKKKSDWEKRMEKHDEAMEMTELERLKLKRREEEWKSHALRYGPDGQLLTETGGISASELFGVLL